MKLVFLGTPAPAVPTLRLLVDRGHRVVSVVTQPDRPVGRSGRAVAPAVKRAALELGLEILQPTSLRDPAFRQCIEQARPDALVVVAYGRMLGRRLREAPLHGAINLHFSLLPKYRGAAPVQWALANGEAETGVSTMQLSRGMDEGDIFLSRSVAIDPGEHAPALQERLAELGAQLLLETLDGLAAGTLRATPQNHAEFSLARMLRREDGNADPQDDAQDLVGRMRGFDPWPGVWLRCGDRRIRLVDGEVYQGVVEEGVAVGVLWRDGDAILMRCGDGAIVLSQVQLEGKRAMPILDAMNGRQLMIGDRLESASD